MRALICEEVVAVLHQLLGQDMIAGLSSTCPVNVTFPSAQIALRFPELSLGEDTHPVLDPRGINDINSVLW